MNRNKKWLTGVLVIITIVLVYWVARTVTKNATPGVPKPDNTAEANKPSDPVTNEAIKDLNCSNPTAANPTAAYIALFEAVKKKETLAIKCQMSKQTLELANFMSQTYKKPLEKVLENGMSESTMQPTLPQIQNENIKGEQGTVDVKRANGTWEQVPFIKEDGTWKLAFGEVMKGTMSITQPGANNPTLNQPAPNAPNPTTRQKNAPPLSQPPQRQN